MDSKIGILFLTTWSREGVARGTLLHDPGTCHPSLHDPSLSIDEVSKKQNKLAGVIFSSIYAPFLKLNKM